MTGRLLGFAVRSATRGRVRWWLLAGRPRRLPHTHLPPSPEENPMKDQPIIDIEARWHGGQRAVFPQRHHVRTRRAGEDR